MRSRSVIIVAPALVSAVLLALTTLIGAAQAPSGPQKPAILMQSSSSALIAQGKKVYRSLDCNTCHILNRRGTPGVGPNLTHIGRTWTQVKLMTMLRHPQKIRPKGWMPAYGTKKISATQLNALGAYLVSLK